MVPYYAANIERRQILLWISLKICISAVCTLDINLRLSILQEEGAC